MKTVKTVVTSHDQKNIYFTDYVRGWWTLFFWVKGADCYMPIEDFERIEGTLS